MSGPRPSFRAVAARRLAEDGGALPPAVEDFLSDTRRLAVRMLPVRLIDVHADRHDEAVDAPALEPLVASIREHGVLEPILVRPVEGRGYQVVAGERRLRAARLAGLETIPAVVREMDDEMAASLVPVRAAIEPPVAPPAVRPVDAAPRPVDAALRPVDSVAATRPVEPVPAPRPRPITNGTYMPPAVVTRREPRVISGPGIPGPLVQQRSAGEAAMAAEERAVAGDDGPRRSRFRFPFLRRQRGSSGEHR